MGIICPSSMKLCEVRIVVEDVRCTRSIRRTRRMRKVSNGRYQARSQWVSETTMALNGLSVMTGYSTCERLAGRGLPAPIGRSSVSGCRGRSKISSRLMPASSYMAKMFSSGVSGGMVCEAARM